MTTNNFDDFEEYEEDGDNEEGYGFGFERVDSSIKEDIASSIGLMLHLDAETRKAKNKYLSCINSLVVQTIMWYQIPCCHNVNMDALGNVIILLYNFKSIEESYIIENALNEEIKSTYETDEFINKHVPVIIVAP